MSQATCNAETQAASDLRTLFITLNFAEGEIMKFITIVDPQTTVDDIVRMIRADPRNEDIFTSGVLCADTPRGKIKIRRGGKKIVIAEFCHNEGYLFTSDVTIFTVTGGIIQ